MRYCLVTGDQTDRQSDIQTNRQADAQRSLSNRLPFCPLGIEPYNLFYQHSFFTLLQLNAVWDSWQINTDTLSGYKIRRASLAPFQTCFILQKINCF